MANQKKPNDDAKAPKGEAPKEQAPAKDDPVEAARKELAAIEATIEETGSVFSAQATRIKALRKVVDAGLLGKSLEADASTGGR